MLSLDVRSRRIKGVESIDLAVQEETDGIDATLKVVGMVLELYHNATPPNEHFFSLR
jgi:hypothetical protein